MENTVKSPCLSHLSSQMARCNDQIKRQYIYFLSSKSLSHAKFFVCGVLPQSFLIFILQATWGLHLFKHIFAFQMRLYTVYSWNLCLKYNVDPEMPHMSADNVIIMYRAAWPRVRSMPSVGMFQTNWLPW